MPSPRPCWWSSRPTIRKDLLKPGEYAQVNIGLPNRQQRCCAFPPSALMFRAAGLEVATLGRDNRIVMKPITIATDLGTQVIVGSGLSADDKVVNNPPDSIADRRQGAGRAAMRNRPFLALGCAACW